MWRHNSTQPSSQQQPDNGAPKQQQPEEQQQPQKDAPPREDKDGASAASSTKPQAEKSSEKTEKQANEGGKSGRSPQEEQQHQIRQTMGAAGLLLVFATFLHFSSEESNVEEITTQELIKEHLIKGHVERLKIINRSVCEVQLRRDAPSSLRDKKFIVQLGNPEAFEAKLEMVQMALSVPRVDQVPIQYTSEVETMALLHYIPSILLFSSLVLMARGMANGNPMGGLPGRGGLGGPMGGSGGGRSVFNMGKVFPDGQKNMKSTTRFTDVAGLEQAKKEVVEFVDFLKDPTKYEKLGARIPKGGLLVGPPGTGKTLLAKAVAGEADCPFFSVSGSDFVEMFAGVGPSRVRDLFKQARSSAPAIIFIDEIDAIGKKRGNGGMSGGNDERENTLNQMLVEMDGFSSGTGVVVLAGTNRVDTLDNALTRPGRFDRQIAIDKPDLKEREQIYMVHLKPVTVHESLSAESIAKRMSALTPGFAGADIANVCNEAAIFAARRASPAVEMEDFERATERVLSGLPKGQGLVDERQKRTVAVHESGHAVVGWFLEHSDPLLKVSIVPRSNGALGFAQYLPEEIALHSKEAILDKIAVALGGRAAEEVFTGKISTGASDDLDRVTKMAYAMVTTYGMNPELGLLSYKDNAGEQFYKPYSEETGRRIDREARQLVDNQYRRVKDLLESKRTIVEALSEALEEKETLVFSELNEILGERPFALKEEYKKFVMATGSSPFTFTPEDMSAEGPMATPEAAMMAASKNVRDR